MTDMERLRQQGTELERELLSSALDDAPAAAARQRALAALGLGAAVATAHGVGMAALGAKTAAAPLATGSKLGLLGILQWVGGGLLAGAVTAGTVAEVAHRNQARPEPAGAPAVAPQARQVARAPRRVAASERAAEIAEPATPAPAHASFGRGAPQATDTHSVVAGEVELLDVARAAIKGGRPEQALALIGSYEKTYPDGVLEPEAELVRMQAFAKLGDRETVAARARSFLSDHPSSPHAAQVRTLLGESAPSAPAVSSSPARSTSVARFPVGG